MKRLNIDINGICNLGCEFCYQNLDGSQLSVDDILGYVVNSQPDVVRIGGGEPLLHDGLLHLLSELSKIGKKVHVSTNATFIPKGMLDLEKSVRDATTVQVSLHVGNPELYREITGRNLFDDVIKNIGKLKKSYNTLINTVIYQRNFKNVPQIAGLAEMLDVPLRVNLVMPVGKGQEVELLDRGQLPPLRSYLFSESFKGGNIESPLLHFNNCPMLETAYGLKTEDICPLDCNAKIYVSPQGRISGCEFGGLIK